MISSGGPVKIRNSPVDAVPRRPIQSIHDHASQDSNPGSFDFIILGSGPSGSSKRN
jgi:hypothetical protein